MIPIPNDVGRDKEVSSTKTREFQDRVRYELSSLYHRSLALTSELNAISSMITLTEKSSVPLLRNYISAIEDSSADDVITPSNIRTDPTGITALETAESHREYGIICSKRVESVSAFTDSAGDLKGNITVIRSTLNGITDETPDAIIENNAKHIFDSRIPYIINFKKEDLSKASIYLDIKSDSIPIKLNALRFIPYPGVGSIILDGMWKDGATEVLGVNSTTLSTPEKTEVLTDTDYDKFTMPSYIHTEVVSTADLRLSFSSRRYITEMGGIVIGIGSLIGELNVYAKTSYAGFTITVPTGKKLYGLDIVPDCLFQTYSNMNIMVYDDINHFNAMNSNFVKRCTGVSTSLNINPDADRKLYLLVELNAPNNISPALSKILVRYS